MTKTEKKYLAPALKIYHNSRPFKEFIGWCIITIKYDYKSNLKVIAVEPFSREIPCTTYNPTPLIIEIPPNLPLKNIEINIANMSGNY